MSSNKIQIESTDSELLYNAVFTQIQECGDIISSILIIYKFITENNINVTFSIDQLRQIALRSVDTDTSTYLWHINALIAASCDFEHLLLGIEIMFDRFLGNKQLFIKEKEQNKAKTAVLITTPNPKTKRIKDINQDRNNGPNPNRKFLGNEIVSFVNSYYDDNMEQTQEIKNDEHNMHENIDYFHINDSNKNGQQIQIKANEENDENANVQNRNYTKNNQVTVENDDNSKEYLKNYRGKISSPISFRLRQQKRMMQSERRVTSRNASKNTSIDFDAFGNENNRSQSYQYDESLNVSSNSFEPKILSPFNVSKFAKTVDLMSNDVDTMNLHRKNV